MTKTVKNITTLVGILIFAAGSAFVGCSSEDSSITDPNGQLQENNYGNNGFSFGDDPIQSQDDGSVDDGSVLPTNVFQDQYNVDTSSVNDDQIGQTN